MGLVVTKVAIDALIPRSTWFKVGCRDRKNFPYILTVLSTGLKIPLPQTEWSITMPRRYTGRCTTILSDATILHGAQLSPLLKKSPKSLKPIEEIWCTPNRKLCTLLGWWFGTRIRKAHRPPGKVFREQTPVTLLQVIIPFLNLFRWHPLLSLAKRWSDVIMRAFRNRSTDGHWWRPCGILGAIIMLHRIILFIGSFIIHFRILAL